jgi:hypothetical protein
VNAINVAALTNALIIIVLLLKNINELKKKRGA